jgi:hypothetical protein
VVDSIHTRLNAGSRQVLSEAAHPDIEYRTSKTGAWTELEGDATFHADRPESLGFEDTAKGEVLPNTGTLKVAEGGTALNPKWHVKAMGRQWAILGLSKHNGKIVYRCKRIVPAKSGQGGTNRGGGR